ncbi:MAG: CRTAC1 family protein [Planctomycetota bacterium]
MRRVNRTAAAATLVSAIVLWCCLFCGSGCRRSQDAGAGTDAAPGAGRGADPGAAVATESPPPTSISDYARSKQKSAAAKDKAAKKEAPRPALLPRFTEVSKQAGVDFQFFNDAVAGRYFLPEIMGGGAAWLDFDGDGLLDLALVDGDHLEPSAAVTHTPASRFYRNLGGGRFVDVAAPAQFITRGYCQGCAVGDYDADGFPDLFVSVYGADLLFHNEGDGTWQLVTEQAGTTDDLWSSSAAWLDVDADGDLDLYVVNYMDVTIANKKVCQYDGRPGYCGPGDYQAVPDRLWLNQGDGTFVDGIDALGFTVPRGKGLALTIVDFDHDLQPEIYVANDMDANFLFTRSKSAVSTAEAAAGPGGDPPASDRTGGGSDPRALATSGQRPLWMEVATIAGCAVGANGENEASMGISLADFDADGFPDLYLTHYYNMKNTFYRNLGGLSFIDDSFRSRSAANSIQSLGFGTIPVDFDRDGAMDLFVANGHVLGAKIPPYEMTPQFLWNEGKARFWDVSAEAGGYFQEKWVGRCAAGGDFDNDGDLDILVTHLERPVALLRNDTPTPAHFLALDLRQTTRLPPLGGRVVVEAGGRRHVVPVQAGGSYLASHDSRLLIGLGTNVNSANVEIHWPSGTVQTLENLPLDRYWTIYPDQEPLPTPGTTRN